MHPLSLAARGHNTGVTQIRKMPGYFWLALFQNLDEVANTHLAAIHKIEQPEPCRIGQRGEQANKIK
jgi:hypothetical protein